VIYGFVNVFTHSLVQYTFVCAECVNAYGDDEMCTWWAMTGECVNNLDFMMRYCHKACSRCDAESIGKQLYSHFCLSFCLF